MRHRPGLDGTRVRPIDPCDIALRQLVGIRCRRTRRNRSVVIAYFGNQALVRCVGHHRVQRLQAARERPVGVSCRRRCGQERLLGLVDVQPAAEVRIDLNTRIDVDLLRVWRILRLCPHADGNVGVGGRVNVHTRRRKARNRDVFRLPAPVVLHAHQGHRHAVELSVRPRPVGRSGIEVADGGLRLEQPEKHADFLRDRTRRLAG